MSIRIAVLDMYDGTPNLGMNGIIKLLEESGLSDFRIFDVRGKGDVPDLSWDIYIFSGGPGNPLEVEKKWSKPFFELIDKLISHNSEHPGDERYGLFICHSFQMVCAHLGVGKIKRRKSQSFGVFPVHKTKAGRKDTVLGALPDPFYAADFRHYQLIQPDKKRIAELNAEILALEKIRPHVPLERAIMSVRISPELLGVQFHPEADPAGMIEHFYKKTVQKKAIEIKGKLKFARMIEDIGDPEKLERTHNHVIPAFLGEAAEKIIENRSAVVS